VIFIHIRHSCQAAIARILQTVMQITQVGTTGQADLTAKRKESWYSRREAA
jgi:hypothetical protein